MGRLLVAVPIAVSISILIAFAVVLVVSVAIEVSVAVVSIDSWSVMIVGDELVQVSDAGDDSKGLSSLEDTSDFYFVHPLELIEMN